MIKCSKGNVEIKGNLILLEAETVMILRGIRNILEEEYGKKHAEKSMQKIVKMILSRLVDTFISRISLTMLPVPNPHNTVCVLSWEEARHWQSRSSGYSSS